jgi:hypothetical protein
MDAASWPAFPCQRQLERAAVQQACRPVRRAEQAAVERVSQVLPQPRLGKEIGSGVEMGLIERTAFGEPPPRLYVTTQRIDGDV